MSPSDEVRPVAVMDDDVKFIRMVERILSVQGVPIQPVTTPDFDEAVKVVRVTNCRAALIDIYMYGEAAGFQVVERLRNDPATSHLPLVVTSGAYREIARNVPFLKHYHCSILPKPFDADALVARLNLDEAGHGAAHTVDGHDAEPLPPLPGTGRRWFTNPLRLPPEQTQRYA